VRTVTSTRVDKLKRRMTTKLNNFKAERMLKNIIGESFSTNIYAELSIENLKKEYNKTMLEILDFSVDKDRPIFF
jgi:PBP1b-binding outer membrane lipoprotein LpoB